MDPRKAPPLDSRSERSSSAQRVADECLRRRLAGESVPDEEIIASHPDLMPDLEQALRTLALVQKAVQRGREASSRGSASPAEPRGAATLELPLDSFSGYEITGEVCRGGQAVVYRATQTATDRDVAIKVMREGPFSGPADHARFDREVHILGQLSHPNIVTIHDSGETAGHFFYTMDYISGLPLDVHVASRQFSVDDSLRLFVKICDAVNVAHLRGIIHRDLKPSNIRVDTTGNPYILDFGLAKLAPHEADAAAMTMTGQFVGSLQWASPEQTEGSPSRIDLRTDVYSLGVILYQILTGRFPYDVTGTMREVMDRILTAEPTRPGTIRRQINDEVETIVLKCLTKERERRYQTAGELARDIRHYLANEPIEAKRDSFAYVLGKHLRRYKLPVAIATAFVTVVTVGFITSLTFWGRAVVERDRAAAAQHATEREAAKAAAINEFLQGMLASVDPSGPHGREVTVREVLDEAARTIDSGSLDDQPEVAAAVHLTLGCTYAELAYYEEAESHLQTALRLRTALFGDVHLDVAECSSALATLFADTGDYDQTERLHRRALAIRRERLGDEHVEVAESLANLGVVLRLRGDYAASEALLREALEMNRRLLGHDDQRVAIDLNCLADLLNEKGDYVGAEPLYREALNMCRRLLGDEHLHVADCLNSLGILLLEKHDYRGAEPLLREALAIRRKALGDEHPAVGSGLSNLGACVHRLGRLDEAERLLRDGLEIKRALLGDHHPSLGSTLATLGIVLCERGKYAEAEPLQREALAIDREVLGDAHPSTAISLFNLAAPLGLRGDWAGAEPLLRDALAIQRDALPDGHPRTCMTLEGLGTALLEQGKFVEAETVLREGLDALGTTLPKRHWLIARVKSRLGASIAGQGRFEEAEPWLLAGGAGMPEDHEMLRRLIEFYEAWGQSEQADRWRAKLPATRPGEDGD